MEVKTEVVKDGIKETVKDYSEVHNHKTVKFWTYSLLVIAG